MSEDYALQASFKVGATLVNVRHKDPDQFKLLCEWLTDECRQKNFIAEAEEALGGATVTQAVANVQAGMPGTQPVAQPAAGGPPTCAHGVMKDLDGKGYKNRYYCAAPFNTPKEQKCPPQG